MVSKALAVAEIVSLSMSVIISPFMLFSKVLPEMMELPEMLELPEVLELPEMMELLELLELLLLEPLLELLEMLLLEPLLEPLLELEPLVLKSISSSNKWNFLSLTWKLNSTARLFAASSAYSSSSFASMALCASICFYFQMARSYARLATS